MKIFSKNAGQFLLEKAKSISEQHKSWRCLYINFSDNGYEYSEGLRTHIVTNIIKELLEHEYGYIYLCDDGDVLILFQGLALPILNKIGEQFKALGGGKHGHIRPEEDLYTIFDLSTHWQIFFTLCKSKAPPELPVKPAPAAVTAPVTLPKSVPLPAPPTGQDLPLPNKAQFKATAAERRLRKRLLVLIVEDDHFARRLANGALKNEYDVVEAGDAATALRLYGDTAPDAVFLDIELPDANGHVVLSKLLAFDPEAFIVMLSAHSIKENILAALEKGAQGFVTKPFAREKLAHYLRQCEMRKRGLPWRPGMSA